jgi:capsular exopolysaccharide synthesis family protein
MNRLSASLATPHPNVQHQDDEIDLLALVSTLWRGKLWIMLTGVLAIFLGGYYAFKVAIPLYPAHAVVALETKQKNVVDLESVLSGGAGGSEEVNTEVEVIRSRNLSAKLVEILNLVEDPEFNGALREPNLFNLITLVQTALGQVKNEPTEIQILNAVVDATIKVVSVSNIRQSLVFSIKVVTQDPKKSALIANTLADLYIQDSLNKKFAATEEASKWLSEKAAELKVELENSEVKLKNFSRGSQLINADALAILSIQLKEMRDRISDLEIKRASLEVTLGKFEQALQSGDSQIIAELAGNARLSRMAKQLAAGSISKPAFDAQARAVLSKMQTDITRANQQYDALVASEIVSRAEIDSQSADLVQLQQFQREAQANTLLYESFLSRLKETAVQQGLQQPDSRLLSLAVPRPAVSPKKGMILVLSAMLGFMLGAGMVLLQEFRKNTFLTADDLEHYTGVNVLSSLPKTKISTRKGILRYAIDKPTSVYAEAVRNFRTSVLLSDVDNPPQVIMLTSSVSGEGKTTQSLILAQNMAGLGKKVLVLEGDVRKCTFDQYFDIKGKISFMSIMSGKATIEEAVICPEGMGIDILIGEKSTVNAADIFTSMKFADLIKELRQKYDYIIIDTPPVLAVPDARIIGQHADAILYTVLWDRTTKPQVRQGLAMLSSVGLHVSGLVLNNIDGKKMKRYGTKQYGYAYAYGDASGYYQN